jgi:hypothetical protein
MKIHDVRFIQFLLLVAGLSVVSWYARTVSDMAQGGAAIGPATAEASDEATSIERLHAGDPIRVVTPDGEYVYRVDPANDETRTLLNPGPNREPVLLTIEPNPSRGPNAKRLVVRPRAALDEARPIAAQTHIGG